MNAKIVEILNTYMDYTSDKANEKSRLDCLLDQRRVYEKLLDEVALEYGKTEEEKKELINRLNSNLAEELESLPHNIRLVKNNSSLADVVFEFGLENFNIFNQSVIDVTDYSDVSNLGLFASEFGEIFEFLGSFIYYSEAKTDLEELLKDYKKNPTLIKEKLKAEISKKLREKYIKKQEQCLEKVQQLTEDYEVLRELLCAANPLRESLLNKIMHRSQVKLQQKQRKLIAEIEAANMDAELAREFVDSVDFYSDVDYLVITDLEALEKLFEVLSKLESRAEIVEKFTKNKQNPLIEKRKRIYEKISRNETLEKMYKVRLDERKFAYRMYLQQLFKDEDLLNAILNLSRAGLDTEQWEAAKALKKFINKNHVVTA